MPDRKENNIKDAIKFIRFKGDKNDFWKSYRSCLNSLKIKYSELSYWAVIQAFCFDNIKHNNRIRIRHVGSIQIGITRLKKSMGKFIRAFNSRNKRSNLNLPKIIKVKESGEDGFLLIFSIIDPSSTQQHYKTKFNPKNTNSFFCVYFCKKNSEIKYFRGQKHMVGWTDWWLKSKLKIKFDELEIKKLGSEELKEMLEDKELKIFEMGLRHPDIGISDKIIVKAKKGDCLDYQEKIRTACWVNKDLSIYDIDYIIFSFKGNKNLRLSFNRKEGYYISLDLSFNFEEQFPKKFKEYIQDNIILFDEIDEKELIKKTIQKEYLDLYDYRNPYIIHLIEPLQEKKIITIIPFLKYWCTNPNCEYSISGRKTPTEKRICLCGRTSTNEFIARYNLKINYKKIISMIGRGLKKSGYSSYKTMKEGYFGFKKSTIIRLKKGDRYFYILLNKKGLKDEEIENLRLLGIPMLIINLKGEIKSTLEGFNAIDSGELIFTLIKEDYSLLKNVVSKLDSNLQLIKWKSFNTSLEILERNNITPLIFEKAIFSLFNLIFPECQRWGGPNLADGSFPLKMTKVRYLLWDAKRYDTSSLLDYIERKAIKKDLKYMEKFNDNFLIKKFGSVKYYLFVTSNTNKEEFLKMKEYLKKQIKSTKLKEKLSRVQILCINKREVIKLAKFVKSNYDSLKPNYPQFIKIIKGVFNKNEGYLVWDEKNKELNEIISTTKIYPSQEDLRKNHP